MPLSKHHFQGAGLELRAAASSGEDRTAETKDTAAWMPSVMLTQRNYAIIFEELCKSPNTQHTAWSLMNSPGTGDPLSTLQRF